ncbi:MAG: 4-hydroxy-tetrahydrodipicolinate synthase [Treponema sp.]|nr:4-hydroxy-tetrahydrodipicolinate synthase [Treponema sp.]MCL2272717.1 4-hydroxy-tetrahydrodipicolinate synthase [Treponema sp.]
MTEFRGAFTALVTPMTESGEVDYEGFRSLIQFQITQGIDGIVPLGTTGECPTLDEGEEDKLTEIAVREAGGKIPVIIGAGSNDTRHMIKYTERAKKMGADAALVVTPYYNKPNDDGLLRHFEAAAKTGIPIIVYNIASRTGRNIPTSLMEKIVAIPGIAGVKESSGDINQMGDVIREISAPRSKNNKFWVLSGDDAFTLPLISLGGDGVISVISNLLPAKVKALVKNALDGNYEEARKLHYELLPFMKTAFIETNPVPIKQALNWAGLPAGPARLPLGRLSPASEAALRKTMVDMGILK